MATDTNGLGHVATVRSVSLTRGRLFGGLCILGFANGIADQVTAAATDGAGLVASVFSTFGISALVWIAFWACPSMMLRAEKQPPNWRDFTVGVGALIAFLLPMYWPSWIALTGIGLYLLIRTARPPALLRRAAWILLATTSAMYWGRLLLIVMGEFILKADAVLVGLVTLSPHYGNTVQFADGGGYVWIAEGCSSLSGISLVVLCWTLLSQWRDLKWSPANLGWCALACLAVSVVNVARMSLIVLDRDRYELIHGPIGATIASWMTLVVIVGICVRGVQGESRSYA